MMYLVELHGHGTSFWPGSSGAPTEWTALTKEPRSSMSAQGGAAHPGHDAHRHRDIGGVGDLDAELGDLAAERAHAERHDVHGAARACSR